MVRRRLQRDTTPSAPKGQPSGVRELLRMLMDDARLRIRQDKAPKFVRPAIPAAVLRLYQEHQQHWRHIQAINSRLKALGYGVQTYKPYELTLQGSPESTHNQKFEDARAARLAKVRTIHQQALLDMLSLQGRDAKAYLESLRGQLEAI